MLLKISRNPKFLTLLSGLLLALCFPAPDLWPLAFVALVPLLFAIDGARPWAAFWRGLSAGFVFFAVAFGWVAVFAGGKAGFLGTFAGYLLTFLMALFVAFFAAAASFILNSKRLPKALKLIAIPSVWVIFEYIRQLGDLGIGWGDLGYTQWHSLLLLKIAPFAGIWGLSWLIVLVNTALWMRSWRAVGASLAAAALMIGCGVLSTRDIQVSGPAFRAASLQANINQDVLWDRGRPADPVYYSDTLETFNQMAAAAKDHGASLCLMAETAMPGYIRFDKGLWRSMSGIARDNDVTLLSGGRDTDTRTDKDLNVAILITSQSKLSDLRMYAKQQLVPFGEFVPFQQQLQWLSVLHMAVFNMEPGADDQPPLDTQGPMGKIGVGVCYESTYPRFLRQQTRSGANFLTVITDDTWFGHTSAARQHFAMSAIRAAECDRWLVRCGATGVSGAFAPDGREVSEVGLFQKGIAYAEVSPIEGETFFVRYGDWFVAACGFILLLTLTCGIRPNQSRPITAEKPTESAPTLS